MLAPGRPAVRQLTPRTAAAWRRLSGIAAAVALSTAIAQPSGSYPPPPGPYPVGERPAKPASQPRVDEWRDTGLASGRDAYGRTRDADSLLGRPVDPSPPVAAPTAPQFVTRNSAEPVFGEDRGAAPALPAGNFAPQPGPPSQTRFRPADELPR